MGRWVRRVSVGLVLIVGPPSAVWSQTPRGVVVDQTGLPLPGATVQLLDGTTIVTSLITGPDGSFVIDDALSGSTVVVKLDGFETTTLSRADATRIVLAIARTTDTMEVIAPTLTPALPTSALMGGSLVAATVARLPSARLKARESLPLLPSVVRGSDGLMQLGGARAHETPLLIDGFDVTDPATGISSINLPFEAVRGIEFLRDPMAVTYSGLLGGLVQIETKPGGDSFTFGAQGFIPRPRLTSPGIGRIEGIFPRIYTGGQAVGGRVRYFAAAEYDFERIPVPDVTRGGGPDITEKSGVMFGRLDIATTTRNQLVLEGLVFPNATELVGLSPRRDESASPDIKTQDLFAGVTNRYMLGSDSVFTIKIGALAHDTTLSPNGSGPAQLSPWGWRGNWFAMFDRRAVRYSASATWDRTILGRRAGIHDLTITGGIELRRLRGTVTETPVRVEDLQGRLVRTVDFASPSSIAARDRAHGFALRDVWHINDRVQIDAGLRLDNNVRRAASATSGRTGIRYALDDAGTTVLKFGIGSFVGRLPLAVEAFSSYPARIDRGFDATTGALIGEAILRPRVERLRMPRAIATTLQIERQLRPGLDAQIGFTTRRSMRLATLTVPRDSGSLATRSNGFSTYREMQVSVRQTWQHDQQVFVSYVRSLSRGQLNDFAALFPVLDTPLVQPAGRARLSTDVPDRWIAWGTFNLPHLVVLSPVVEWHTGFPYSTVDERYLYVGEPNSSRFPAFMAADLVAYKEFTVKKRHANLGVQLFNLTNHFNPRDVHPVVGAAGESSRFTNSVGPVLRGFMLIKW